MKIGIVRTFIEMAMWGGDAPVNHIGEIDWIGKIPATITPLLTI